MLAEVIISIRETEGKAGEIRHNAQPESRRMMQETEQQGSKNVLSFMLGGTITGAVIMAKMLTWRPYLHLAIKILEAYVHFRRLQDLDYFNRFCERAYDF